MKGMPNEPPDWWKRWRPLRWLAALIGLLLIGKLVMTMQAKPESLKAEAVAASEPAPASSEDEAAAAAQPVAAPVPPASSEAAGAAVVAKADDAPPADTAMATTTEIIEDDPITPASVMAAYTARPPEAQRLLFFAPFRSYASVDDTQRALEKAGYEPQVTARHARVPDGVPPSDLDIMKIYDYRHLGETGTLELQFFNDRLYQAEFEPHDAAAYRAQFRREWPQVGHEKSGRSEVVNGSLRIASSLDLAVSDVGRALHSRPYVLWQDLRLLHQRDDWDYQFAKLAAQ